MSSTTSAVDAASVLAVARLELLVAAPEVPVDVPADAHLLREVGIDAPTFEAFAARVEYRFGLTVPDAQWPGLGTLAEVASYVVERARRRSLESLP
jgi:hypothetical protein